MKSTTPELHSEIRFFESTTSTQDEAKIWLRDHADSPFPCWFWAATQSAGRGRQSKPWNDSGSQQAVLLSVAMPWNYFESQDPSLNWGLLPLFSGYVLWKVLSDHSEMTLTQKWPNDLGVFRDDGEFYKMAGILCERVGRDRAHHIVGWGVNLTPVHVPGRATLSLSECLRECPTVESVVLKIKTAWEFFTRDWLAHPLEFEDSKLAEIKEISMKNFWGRRGVTPQGVHGITRDLDDSGNLIVNVSNSESASSETELTLRSGEFQLLAARAR